MEFCKFSQFSQNIIMDVPCLLNILLGGGSIFGGIFRKTSQLLSGYIPGNISGDISPEIYKYLSESDIDVIILKHNWERIKHIVLTNPAVNHDKIRIVENYNKDATSTRILLPIILQNGSELIIDISIVLYYVPIYGYLCDTIAFGSKEMLRNPNDKINILSIKMFSLMELDNHRYTASECWYDIVKKVARKVMIRTNNKHILDRQLNRTSKLIELGYEIIDTDLYILDILKLQPSLHKIKHQDGLYLLLSNMYLHIDKLSLDEKNMVYNKFLINAIEKNNTKHRDICLRYMTAASIDSEISAFKFGASEWFYKTFINTKGGNVTLEMYLDYIKNIVEIDTESRKLLWL
jgi:hypothetical protein